MVTPGQLKDHPSHNQFLLFSKATVFMDSPGLMEKEKVKNYVIFECRTSKTVLSRLHFVVDVMNLCFD